MTKPARRRGAATLAVVIPERLQPLLAETSELAARFQRAGFRLYLVGGVVRDALLGRLETAADDERLPYDLDFTTDARPDDIEAIVAGWADAVWLQGKRFGTIGLRKNGRRMEITTHRAEAYHPDSPQARRRLRRRHRGRPVAAGLHRQRHGPGPARTAA